MTREKSLFDENDPDAEAAADAKAGRVISHDAVKRWIRSLGAHTPLPRQADNTPDRLDRPS